MLKQHSQLMLLLLAAADAVAVAVAWLLSYWIRFNLLPVDPAKGVPELTDKFLPMLPLVVVAHLLIFNRIRLYRPRRSDRPFRETRDIVKAFVVAVLVVIVIDYAFPETHKISRGFVVTYAVVGTVCFVLFRGTVRIALHALRRRGYNQRNAAIVGSGRNAQRLYFALCRNAWTGIQVAYFVDDLADRTAANFRHVPIRGPLDQLRTIVEQDPVDCIFIALQTQQSHRVNDLLEALGTSMADVRLVPEFNPFFTMRPDVTRFDGLPVLALRQTPLYGWNAILKRAFDLAVGTGCLALAAGPMLLIAIGVKLSSPGPVFYRQRRMGLDGREFEMLKFRTMRADAERESGPVWAGHDDPRRTRLGAFLRRTSLDELPQLLNVLAGEMSLVGPRPERPEFIAQFKQEIPRYMLRHKTKAGMTGYAQIKGLRGNTSLKKRIQHDVHYIANWSLGLDIRILLQTVTGVWFSRHEG
ncbi:MAG: undecaprenyl-phosphate glucose phosphotransferase [Phycisphaerae bacterium]|jgi:Undecaprenyl-phosphate glucose phosphotransferase